jgi:Uncharacterized protein conserved in bacteria (DUF2188)
MSPQADVHVVPDDGRWKVEVEGGGVEGNFDTQEEATRAGREISRRNESELVIHARSSQIRKRDTHGHDPRNIPG